MSKLEKLRERVLHVITSVEKYIPEIQDDSYRLAETNGGLQELYWVLRTIDDMLHEEEPDELENRKKSMIIATYKQWLDGTKYLSGYYKEYTSIYKDKSELQTDLKRWEEEGNPMILLGVWEL